MLCAVYGLSHRGRYQGRPLRRHDDRAHDRTNTCILYCIVLYLQPVLNPKSYDGARVLEAAGRPLLVKGRS